MVRNYLRTKTYSLCSSFWFMIRPINICIFLKLINSNLFHVTEGQALTKVSNVVNKDILTHLDV